MNFSESDSDFKKFVSESLMEILRILWQNQCELRAEVAELKTKVIKVDKRQSVSQELSGVEGTLSVINLKISFSSKEEFDVFEEKMNDFKFFLKIVSHIIIRI